MSTQRGSIKQESFDLISRCKPQDRSAQTVASDLDGTLLISKTSVSYCLLVALEAGSYPRALAVLLSLPLAYLAQKLVSESLAIQIVLFITFAGLKIRDVEYVARSVLPRFYAEDVHPHTWKVFRSFGRKYVVTASPRIMVEPFVTRYLGVDKVLGTELEVTSSGSRATGFVRNPGVLVGEKKRYALVNEFGANNLPDLGLGDSKSDYDFMSICKEGYIVPQAKVKPFPGNKLLKQITFQDGRLVHRPTPMVAFLTFLWIPIGFILSVVRVHLIVHFPAWSWNYVCKLLGIRIIVKGTRDPPCRGMLFVSNHRSVADPIIIAISLKRKIRCANYEASECPINVTSLVIPVVTLKSAEGTEADEIRRLLKDGDLVTFPEGTTCREPFLLKFNPLFAELSEGIVPVAIKSCNRIFHGSSVKGYKWMDPYFSFMDPIPTFEVTFLSALPLEMTCKGGKTESEVAGNIQRAVAEELGLQCTNLTWEDKFEILLGTGEGNLEEDFKT
uniref:Phospholipid/glycerol acyltransferase domain-containing protein n=1 Tax=Kalanchoe fedtschenkoi TaxID=63787 RepID=A0A7N0T6X8_KALFE